MSVKHFGKAIIFLLLLLFFDIIFRAGFIAQMFPLPIPSRIGGLILYCLFAGIALGLTILFCRWDNIRLSDLGISFSKNNRSDFFFGLLIGIIFWTIVSYCQSLIGDFSWTFKSEILILNLIFGLFFIFIADLGTELFTRGYPLTRFDERFGPTIAIGLMSIFVGLRSYSINLSSELLMYSMLIPALHVVFFSIIYLKTRRLGGALGVHTGANFVTICVFDLDGEQTGELIPHGFLQPNVELGDLSIHALQMPYVFGAIVFSIMVFFWWPKSTIKGKNAK